MVAQSKTAPLTTDAQSLESSLEDGRRTVYTSIAAPGDLGRGAAGPRRTWWIVFGAAVAGVVAVLVALAVAGSSQTTGNPAVTGASLSGDQDVVVHGGAGTFVTGSGHVIRRAASPSAIVNDIEQVVHGGAGTFVSGLGRSVATGSVR